MRLPRAFASVSILLMLVAGCDGGGGTPAAGAPNDEDAKAATPDAATGGTQTRTTAIADTSAQAEATVGPDVATAQVEPPPPAVNYPEGPYGTANGDVVANLEFYDPFTDQIVALDSFYNDPDALLLFVISSAGWCKPCQKTSKDLQAYYEAWGGDGLRILYTLREDVEGKPLYVGPETVEYSKVFMEWWMNTFGPFTYPLVVDGDADGDGMPDVLGPYYQQNSIPFVMGVKLKPGSETKAMEIIYKDHGESVAFIQYQVTKYVYGGY